MGSMISTGKVVKFLGVTVNTTRLCRENQAVGLGDLNVPGRLGNGKLARAIADVGLYEFRRQTAYKAQRSGTNVGIADGWYPSSRLWNDSSGTDDSSGTAVCGWKNESLTLKDREWDCPQCATHRPELSFHDRDVNAARNLERLATETALPEASPTSDGGAAAERVCVAVGEVTPVRYDSAKESGQEENGAHVCTRF